jgi:hypothetical protein
VDKGEAVFDEFGHFLLGSGYFAVEFIFFCATRAMPKAVDWQKKKWGFQVLMCMYWFFKLFYLLSNPLLHQDILIDETSRPLSPRGLNHEYI